MYNNSKHFGLDGLGVGDVGAGRARLVAGFTTFHNPHWSQRSGDGGQFSSYQKFFKIWRTLISNKRAVGEDLSQPRIIGDHHPVMFSDDVCDGGQPGVVGHSKHWSDVTFLSHNSLESF